MVAVAAMEAVVMVAVAAMEAAVMVAVVTAAGMEAAVLASEAVVLADSEAVVLADTEAVVLADSVAAAVLVDSALDVDEKKLTVDYSDYIVMYNPYYLNKIVQYRPCAFEPKKLYLINKVKV